MHNKSFSIAEVKWRLPSIACIQKISTSSGFLFLLFSFERRMRCRCFALIFFSKTQWYDAHHSDSIVSFVRTQPNEMTEWDEYGSIALPHNGSGSNA